MKRRKRALPKKRNPVARAVRKIRPQVVPDTRRKKLTRAQKKEVREEVGEEES